MYYRIFILLCAMSCVCGSYAQMRTEQSYILHGLLVDDVSGEPLPDVSIEVLNLHRGTTSNAKGRFTLEVNKGALLRFSLLAYQNLEFTVPDSVLDLDQSWLIRMHYSAVQLEQLNVEEDKKVPLAYKSDVFKQKPTVGHLFLNPISYFYYFFSKREKSKREMLSVIEREYLVDKYAYIIDKSQVAGITGFQGEALERCMMYCNMHLELTPKDSETMVRDKLMIVLSDYYKTIK